MRQQTLKRGLSLWALILLASLILVVPRFSRAQLAAQAPARLPAAWNDAVTTLAGKIVNMAGRAKTISLSVKNISSLSTMDAPRIHDSLAAELRHRQFSIAEAQSAQVQVTVTLSEGVEGYIWVAQARNESGEQTAMISVSKPNVVPQNAHQERLVLEKKLVWQQPGKFLDFAVASTPDGSAQDLVILEPDRFTYYRSPAADRWQLWQSVRIAHSPVWGLELRDMRGSIDSQSGAAFLSLITCAQTLDPEKARCAPEMQELVFPWRRVKIPGHEDSETLSLSDACGEKSVVLSSGSGDRTQPDSIQGYLAGNLAADIFASGAAVPLDGPVISFARDQKGSGARAIVRNLKTGNYEGYLITATCGP